MTPSLFQILQIPSMRPVYVREHSSKMYSSSAYFLSGWLSSLPMMVIYPFLTSSICFFFLGFTDTSVQNYFRWTSTLLMVTMQGGTFGFMLGCVMDKIDMGIIVLSQTLMWFLLGSGMFLSLKGAKKFVKFLGLISPFRYSIERLLRTLLHNVWYTDMLCNHYEYNYKEKVVPISLSFLLIFFILGWIVMGIRGLFV